LAEADGIRVRVVNYSVSAYVNWQEVIRLEELVSGKSVPDLAIFYDGFNELLSQFVVGPHFGVTNLRARVLEDDLKLGHKGEASSTLTAVYHLWATNSALHGLTHAFRQVVAPTPVREYVWAGDQSQRADERGAGAASIYSRGVRVVRRLADRYGFRAAFFWQPFLYSKRLLPSEQPLVGFEGTSPAAWRRASNVARSRLAPSVVDLSGALDGMKAPVMYDVVHTNEVGARRLAEALYARLRPTLVELARRRRS
jgi:hypothetical protein